jgi:hypothetical protein
VTNRIHDAVSKVASEWPDVGRHLRNSVHTGLFCSYDPDRPIRWRSELPD